MNTWTPQTLLVQRGYFLWGEVAAVLELPPDLLMEEIERIRNRGEDLFQTLGAKKVWGHWVVRMEHFAPYYRRCLMPRIQPVDEQWDFKTMLRQEGLFRLEDVCKILPFTAQQLLSQAQENPDEEMGVWEISWLKTQVVDMPRFRAWIQRQWERELAEK